MIFTGDINNLNIANLLKKTKPVRDVKKSPVRITMMLPTYLLLPTVGAV